MIALWCAFGLVVMVCDLIAARLDMRRARREPSRMVQLAPMVARWRRR